MSGHFVTIVVCHHWLTRRPLLLASDVQNLAYAYQPPAVAVRKRQTSVFGN